jgi:hypothetical protein
LSSEERALLLDTVGSGGSPGHHPLPAPPDADTAP